MSRQTVFQDPYPEVHRQDQYNDDTYKEVVHNPQKVYPEVLKEDFDTSKITATHDIDGIRVRDDGIQVHEPKKLAWYRKRGWILGIVAIIFAIIVVAATVGGLLGSRKSN